MPVEIGQLVINARVIPDEHAAASPRTRETTAEADQQHEVIERCVAEVLRILEDRMER